VAEDKKAEADIGNKRGCSSRNKGTNDEEHVLKRRKRD
jgi:hypothetical protein